MSDSSAVTALVRDLAGIFSERLRSVVTYGQRTSGPAIASLAIVDQLSAADLRACAGCRHRWQRAGLATPLLLGEREFGRSLDAFPFEFGAILDDYRVVHGADPFQGLSVDAADLRRACEVQVRSHLLHLREAFIETEGRGKEVAALIRRSAAPLAALLQNIRRLDGSAPVEGVLARVTQAGGNDASLSADAAQQLFPDYLEALEQLTRAIDRWERL
jgi:hypothetical protein